MTIDQDKLHNSPISQLSYHIKITIETIEALQFGHTPQNTIIFFSIKMVLKCTRTKILLVYIVYMLCKIVIVDAKGYNRYFKVINVQKKY